MYRLSLLSNAIELGVSSFALVAGPPSPVEPSVAPPATVEMMPVAALTLRTEP